MRLLVLLALVAAPLARAQGYGGGTDPQQGVVRAEVVHRYYDVEGRSESDLLQGMLHQGPEWEGRRFFGLTTSDVRYVYNRIPTATGCDLANIVVTTTVTIVLPRWQPPRGTPYMLERDWRRFERTLRAHEDGHRRLLEEEAEQIRLALAGLRTARCDEVDRVAQREVTRVRQHFGAMHRNYDARTEHGRTQGAVWPPGH
ncbi:MAG: DUF922 domain-containing protein [Rubricoccaceae bacterium]|nr:DUF922 domain-containing protein [Rubricoccaceae bacterium]